MMIEAIMGLSDEHDAPLGENIEQPLEIEAHLARRHVRRPPACLLRRRRAGLGGRGGGQGEMNEEDGQGAPRMHGDKLSRGLH